MKFDKDVFDEILRYIEENISAVTEKDISNKFRINRCYLSELFKKYLGGGQLLVNIFRRRKWKRQGSYWAIQKCQSSK